MYDVEVNSLPGPYDEYDDVNSGFEVLSNVP